jgi:hypothetical protein
MDRRTYPTLLLPLMAILALVYPMAFSPRQTTTSPGTESKILHQVARLREESISSEDQPAPEVAEVHNARKILSDFFGRPRSRQSSQRESDPRDLYALDFVIVTIPDPLDSRLPYLFDRNLGSIQRAVEADHFVLDRLDLPWLEELRKKQAVEDDGGGPSAAKDVQSPHSFETQPGFILFRSPDPLPTRDGPRARLLLLFLVGETPTTGIHKDALISALKQIDWLCNLSSSPGTTEQRDFDWFQSRPPAIPAPLESACSPVKILGPTFSGSADSLDFALHSWRASNPLPHSRDFRIVSGSATAISFSADRTASCSSSFQFSDGKPFRDFGTTVVQDTIALSELLGYLRSHARAKESRVGLLTEGNTAYGSSLRNALAQRTGTLSACSPAAFGLDLVDLPFPLHISRLRSESEKARRQRQQSSQQERPDLGTSMSLPLPTEDDSGNAVDSIPPVSQLDISSSELMLSNLFSTISHEQFRYIGIAATDVRDVIFLARENPRTFSCHRHLYSQCGSYLFASRGLSEHPRYASRHALSSFYVESALDDSEPGVRFRYPHPVSRPGLRGRLQCDAPSPRQR